MKTINKAQTSVGQNKVSLSKQQIELFQSSLPNEAYLIPYIAADGTLVIDVKEISGRNTIANGFIAYTKQTECNPRKKLHWKNPNLYIGHDISLALYPNRKLAKKGGKIQLTIMKGEELLFGKAKDKPPKICSAFIEMFRERGTRET